jgi:FecR protein
MKVNRIAGFVIISLLVTVFLLTPGISFGKEMTGKIVKVSRDCFVDEKGEGNWIKASVGMAVNSGFRLKTGEKSSMIVKLNGNAIKLGPMTEIELSDFTSETVIGASGKEAKKTSTIVGLVMGKVYGSVKKLTNGSIFEIRTDISIAGVRGTAFSIDRVGENSFSTTVVLWGVVSFLSIDPNTGNPIGSPVNVGRKKSSTIESGDPASPADTPPKDLIKALSTAYNDITKTLESLFGGGDGGGGSCP